MICHTPGCPTSKTYDDFGRPMSVEHGGLTQSVLQATGHHLLNRYTRGELAEHLKSWSREELRRVSFNLNDEHERVSLLEEALAGIQDAIIQAYDKAER